MKLDKKSLKKMFPNLSSDLECEESKVTLNSVRTDVQIDEQSIAKRGFTRYEPDVIDFIRRCDTERQAGEIVTYLENRGEIKKPYAQRLRKHLERLMQLERM